MTIPRFGTGRLGLPTGLFLLCQVALLGNAGEASAQELPLKRDMPGVDSIVCPTMEAPRAPTREEAEQAARLASEADQESILGNRERARDLLARATDLDPTSMELAYRYARTLEQLGEYAPAIQEFCRVEALGVGEAELADIRFRLNALVRMREPEIPQQARSPFMDGLRQADLGNLPRAEAAFGEAFAAAPDWADAVYNRGVIRIRRGDQTRGVEDLRRYLELAPNASDALAVSQRMGQLQVRPATSVRPGSALGLGLLIPGMGQFYTGRAVGGFTVLALAGGAAAAGILIRQENVKCVGSPPSGGECPPDRIISSETTSPYLVYGVAAAGIIGVIGAVEAYIKAKRAGEGAEVDASAAGPGSPRFAWPNLTSRGGTLHLNLLRVTF